MEAKIVIFLNQYGFGQLDKATELISSIPLLITLLVIISFIIWQTDKIKRKPVLLALSLALVIHFSTTEWLLKDQFTKIFPERERPYLAYPNDITPIGKTAADSSFPSSHMASTAAVLLVLTYYYPYAIILTAPSLIFMAFARMHNGMHYPSDVFAGTALGLIYGFFTLKVSSFAFPIAEKKRRKR